MKRLTKGQKIFAAFLAVMAIASVVAEFAGHQEGTHQKHWWSSIPMFWILFGLIGCLLLIVFAKNILAPFIYKKEDYYNE